MDAGADLRGRTLYVGHVGIIDVRDGVPWVIEAVLDEGVREVAPNPKRWIWY